MKPKNMIADVFDRLIPLLFTALCGALIGGGWVINALALQNVPELASSLPDLIKIQQAADQASFYGYVGIAITLVIEFLLKRKKHAPQPASLA
jgi:mannose/fructose/N-acetylgalactosamine-specific phosphotransferase system component IID